MKVKWLRKALNNLENIHDYIAKDNPEAALRLITKIRAGVKQLADFPLMGHNGRVEGTRELVIGNTPYFIVYRIKDEVVEILRILHSAKKFPE
jgi:toxin ParE1/3/4